MRKIAKKIISAVLVMAVCISTLCGSLISANAATAGNTYSVIGEPISQGQRTTEVYVTLTSESGFTKGKFDLMFSDDQNTGVLDYDTNGDDEIKDIDTNGDDIISKYLYNEDEKGNWVLQTDEEGNRVLSGDIIENRGTYLPNVYNQSYVNVTDENGDPVYVTDAEGNIVYENGAPKVQNKLSHNLFGTKIELVDGTKAEGDFSISDFVNPYDNFTDEVKATYKETDDRYFLPNISQDYIDSCKSTESLAKYYRDYTSTVAVATNGLSYTIETVSEDSLIMPTYNLYAEGFKDISFATKDDVAYTSLTFKVTFDFSGRTDRFSATNPNTNADARQDGRWGTDNYIFHANDYQLNVENLSIGALTLSDFTNSSGSIVNTNDARVKEDANGFHVHSYSIKNTNSDYKVNGDIAIGPGVCGRCQHETTMIAVVGDNGVNFNESSNAYYYNGYRAIYGANIVYQNDGSLSLNLHFATGTIADEKLIITDENGNLLRYSDSFTGDSKYTATKSFFADRTDNADDINAITEKRILGRIAKMVTIDGISAKDINKKLYISRYTPDKSSNGGETAQMGRTYEFSLGDYCESVITGEGVYYVTADGTQIDKTTDKSAAAQIEKDKAVAAALINYGDAAAAALSSQRAEAGATITWNGGTEEMNLTKAQGTEEDPYIIENAEQLAWLASVATPAQTHGKFFEIDENIDNIVLQPSGTNEIMALSDYSKVEEYFTNSSKGTINWCAASNYQSKDNVEAYFCGTLDGNGVKIYGMKRDSGGALFSGIGFAADIKNISIKNSYVYTGWYGAMLACYIMEQYTIDGTLYENKYYPAADSSTGSAYNNINAKTGFHNIEVSNCKIVCDNLNSVRNNSVGLMVGWGGSVSPFDISGLLIYGNDIYYTQYNVKKVLDSDGNPIKINASYNMLFGTIGNDSTAINANNIGACKTQSTFSDSIILGAEIAGTINGNNIMYKKSTAYSGVYTDYSSTVTSAEDNTVSKTTYIIIPTATLASEGGLMILDTAESIKGVSAKSKMTYLDWDNNWAYGMEGEYPTFADIDYQDSGKIIYWSGDLGAHPTEQDSEGTYIINTAEELCYVATKAKVDETSGNSYKIADNIDKIILQPYVDDATTAAIMGLSTSDEVKSYFTSVNTSPKNWVKYAAWNAIFDGNFDGNGVEIYGLYADGIALTTNNNNKRDGVALFPQVDGGTSENPSITIENIAIKNSYFRTYRRMGAIVGITYGSRGGAQINGKVNFDSCTVANCYMVAEDHTYYSGTKDEGEKTTSAYTPKEMGILIGTPNDELFDINNCLIYDNYAYHVADGANITLFGTAYTIYDSNNVLIENQVTNSIILGADPYSTNSQGFRGCGKDVFENVYTDAYNESIVTQYGYSETDIKQISSKDLIGENAKTVIDETKFKDGSKFWAENGGAWYTGNRFTYPGLSKAENSLPYEMQGVYAALDSTFACDTYGEGDTEFGMYVTSLNLKANPYMAFTFAFHEEYKDNRDKISVRFETSTDGINYATTKEVNVTNADGTLADGWTNNKGAGRYHLYKYSDISVGALAYGVKVYATYAGGTEKYLGQFSVGGFALNVANSNMKAPSAYCENSYEAAKALLAYVQAINLRYNQ